jgi:hypothetical protein
VGRTFTVFLVTSVLQVSQNCCGWQKEILNHKNKITMKKLKYALLLLMFALASCSEDPILESGGQDDDDRIAIPPPPINK